MEVKIALKEFLKKHNMNRHGVIQEIADDIGLNRRTISKLYHGTTPTVTLDTLSQLSTWLNEHGVAASELPAGLFSTGRTSLWQTIAKQGKATFYVGEYQRVEKPSAAWRWISRRDAAVATNFVQQLSMGSDFGPSPPQLNFQYVPLRFPLASYDISKEPLSGDISRTSRIYERMLNNSSFTSSIIIGSQRVNYLMEFFVADLFGCKPFVQIKERPAFPFFFVYRERDHKIPSCFGALKNPFRRKDASVAGLHYFEVDRRKWITCPWKEQKKDAGVIISIYDHSTKSVTIAVFGFSGRATDALGRQIILKEHLFWPPYLEHKGKEIGVFICRLDFPAKSYLSGQEDFISTESCEIKKISAKILQKYLR